MEIIRKINSFGILFLVIVFFSACTNDVFFTEYTSLKNAEWKSNEKVSFSFSITDTISAKNLFINIRNTAEYPFSNLYVIASLQFPNGTKVVDTLQYEMANEYGEFLGKGFTVKENKLFYKEAKVFPQSGDYQFSIYQAMRKQGETEPIPVLKGIQDVGFSIENNKN